MDHKQQRRMELQVGIIAGIALVLLVVMIFSVEKIRFGNPGYRLFVSFKFVDAIKPQADVLIGGGVRIGAVESVNIRHERIFLEVRIHEQVKIPEDAKFQILSKGMMGDKYLNVVPQAEAEAYLQPGDHVEGVEPGTIDDAVQRFGKVADSIRGLLGDQDMKTGFTSLLKNLANLSASLDRIVRKNEKRIDRAVKDLTVSAGHLRGFSKELDVIGEGLTGALDEENRRHLKRTLGHLADASEKLNISVKRIEEGRGTLGALIHDEKMAENLRSLVKEVRDDPWKLLWKQ